MLALEKCPDSLNKQPSFFQNKIFATESISYSLPGTLPASPAPLGDAIVYLNIFNCACKYLTQRINRNCPTPPPPNLQGKTTQRKDVWKPRQIVIKEHCLVQSRLAWSVESPLPHSLWVLALQVFNTFILAYTWVRDVFVTW